MTDEPFIAKYRASCYCAAVQYEARADPVDAKICHCLACQKLHGAPMQWAAIFHKDDVKMTKGEKHLRYYSGEFMKWERILPCKVSCAQCGTLIADEGRRMWLAFPSLFDFSRMHDIPDSFKICCRISRNSSSNIRCASREIFSSLPRSTAEHTQSMGARGLALSSHH